MLLWILALLAGAGLAYLTYRQQPSGPAAPVIALRAVAGVAVAALLLNVPLGSSQPLAPWVGVDVSASWATVGGAEGWARAREVVDSLRAEGADSLFVFGDSVRADSLPTVPTDRNSRVGALIDAAIAVGRPLVLVTDGALDDPDRVARLPRGSALRVIAATPRPDAAIALLDAPGGALGGDTISVRLLTKAGAAGAAAGSVTLRLDDRVIQTAPLAALEPFEEREVRIEVSVPANDATRRLSAALGGGDAVQENDTASAELVVSGAAAATFISSAPDQDARFALAVLRGTRRGPVQGFWRVAPGQWRVDGSLRPVTEQAVRSAAASSPLLVLHGDTAIFGAPRSLTRRALVLLAPPPVAEDYYPVGTGDSPLAAVLAGVPWDSLPPLDVAATPARGYSAVVARRARRFDERSVITLEDGPRRSALIAASGLWRWRLRGGRAADAYNAVWGSIFDWVGADLSNAATRDRANGAAGRSEYVPRRATVREGAVGDGVPLDQAPRALGAWWLAAIAIAALCAEWLLRRKIGLR